jgi:hypothetical protein
MLWCRPRHKIEIILEDARLKYTVFEPALEQKETKRTKGRNFFVMGKRAASTFNGHPIPTNVIPLCFPSFASVQSPLGRSKVTK